MLRSYATPLDLVSLLFNQRTIPQFPSTARSSTKLCKSDRKGLLDVHEGHPLLGSGLEYILYSLRDHDCVLRILGKCIRADDVTHLPRQLLSVVAERERGAHVAW